MSRTRNCAALVIAIIASQGNADPPALQTPRPVIYLADNLNEQDNLGWCIDTQGRGFSDRLHAHSCKPQGGDVQFVFEPTKGQIQSFEYPEFCLAYDPQEQTDFGLIGCDKADGNQLFTYDPDNREFTLKNDEDLCISVGQTSNSAGPFMSRQLLLTQCQSTDVALKEWIILQ